MKRITKDGTLRAGTNRRDFLKQSALVAGMGVWVATGKRAWGVEEQSPNSRINIASIGIGGKGDSDSDQAAKHGNLVAICDIDDKRLDGKGNRYPDAKKFNDFRKMFDKMHKEIDAVTISTPDHTHAVATMMAIKLGKHVYTQKPLTHDVWEARQLRLAARQYKVASQMGNQGSAENGLREAVEIVHSGALGAIKEAHVWTNRPIWPQAPGVMARLPEEPVPANVHWDEFIGTAPMRPFNAKYQPFNWRGWWDYGTGALGDMGCHTANLLFRALKLEYPSSIQGDAGDLNPETYPSWATVNFEFPARGDMVPVKVTWYEGHKDGKKNRPPIELLQGEKFVDSGSLLVGEKGTLYSPDDYGANYVLLSKEAFKDYKKPEPTLARNGHGDEGMKVEWLEMARGGKPAYSNFDNAGLLAEFILLGNVAIKAEGKKLEWDGPNMKFPNAPDAEKFLKREYRTPWSL
jgi:predicted dehydrogenase